MGTAARVRILEATIRDGGYMVDHRFTRLDLATLVGGLDRAGMPLIEVGHGNGVGSELFRDPKLRSRSMPLVDDAGHAAVALAVAGRAKVGVVLTAGQRFVPVDYIDRLAALGFAFVRLAVMPDELDDEFFAYVRRIKDRGMTASINMMQTYVKPPAEVGELARRGADNGADWFYIVDSAGAMMVDEVKRYVTAVLAAAPLEVGLHAHNNLGCAVANALAAVDAGATLVDGTLNGIGRATGNPATEQLAVALRDRLAHDVHLDVLVALGNAIRSLFDAPGNDPMDFVSGGARVHSRNVPKVFEAARARDRAPGSFLLAVGAEATRRGQLNSMAYGDDLYDAAARDAAPATPVEPTDAMLAAARDEILARWNGGAQRALDELGERGLQRHLPTVAHFSRAAAEHCDRPVPWQGSTVGVTIPWAAPVRLELAPEREPDYVLVDEGDAEPPVRARRAVLRVSFATLFARAVADACAAVRGLGFAPWTPGEGKRPAGRVAVVLGDDAALDDALTSGDVGILACRAGRPRIDAARRRGVKLMRPLWSRAVAHATDALLAYERELAGDAAGALVSPALACGADQASWDATHATLLDADDPPRAAAHASAAYLAAILAGTRRF